MIALDTNILVRIVTNDSPEQAQRASALLLDQRIFIAKTVLLEMEWVLRFTYQLERTVILNAFSAILGLSNVETEDILAVSTALTHYAGGLDFADALHIASCGNADKFVTFDAKLSKKAKKILTLDTSIQLL